MRILSILILLLGLAIAGTVAYMVMQRLTEQDQLVAQLRGKVAKNIKFVPVAIATKDLKYGKRLGDKDVKFIDWPSEGVPKAAFNSKEKLFGAEGVETEPRTVLRAIDAGEIISVKKVSDFGQGGGLSTTLGQGLRAFALRVDVASGVSGFLRPGDNIDVYWTGRVGNETISRLILDGITLIAIDQISDEDINRSVVARTITVAVPPRTVASLAQAQATGKLQMALRGVEDTEKNEEEIEINQRILLDIKEPEKAAPVAKKQVCTVVSRQGGEVKRIPVPCN
ncbi:Flp pilus assembly protein CpaB [Amylibacter kogurei]|uniref:Flp pilus assembly protein CpaB n=1 Tax=Paramylibacter kogurei TaxID=1889778 RepID=A0A2G5K581_9RHOB|nr:Flp pilus assembly protein CpaB [Amylibacter kogurei]PIB24040.1 Flp pilus assembly protein CpaB [Amylibacter kogurei]